VFLEIVELTTSNTEYCSDECPECIRDKNWHRVTFTNSHNKDCKQYSNYDNNLEKQRKYAATLSQIDQCMKIHSSPRPIDAHCTECYQEYWLSHGHHCEKIGGLPMGII